MEPTQFAAVVFTSGTTGTPKAVAHAHRNLLAACDCWRYPVPIASGEVMCSFQAHVKATIAPYKYPRDVKFLDRLPRTSSGKVERYRLQQQ